MKSREDSVIEQHIIALPEYGVQKIMHCADSYRSIAKTYLNFHKELAGKEVQSRQGMIYHRQALENQNFMAEQFLYMADKLTEVARESYQFVPAEQKQYRQLARCLKKEGIEVKHVYFMENENRDGVLEITMRSVLEERISVTEVAEILGLFFDMRLRASVNSDYFVGQDYTSFTFLQEPAYCVLSGQASAVKNGEDISGDSILVSDSIDGHMIYMLADGVGSGKEASRHSEKVLDFMEKFLIAGYSKETAIQVLNGMLLQDGEEAAMSTLDICDLDLYRGVCEFHKIGAVHSYHKRGYLVEKIWIENLPLGAFRTLNLDVVRRRLEEGDYVIMLTDGVVEELVASDQEEKLNDYISSLTIRNPRDMAQHILQYCIGLCKGRIQDDLTVLVFGVWKN